MDMEPGILAEIEGRLDAKALGRVDEAVDRIVDREGTRRQGGRGHRQWSQCARGVTTLIAELMRVGLVDAVSTSAAVVAHEMGGTLDEVKRCPGASLGVPASFLPGAVNLNCPSLMRRCWAPSSVTCRSTGD